MKIKKENRDEILKLIDKINKKSNLNIAKGSDVILTLFLNDYYKDNKLSEKSEAGLIKEVSKIDNSIDCKAVLNILYEEGILLKAVCKDINNHYINKYALSYIYRNYKKRGCMKDILIIALTILIIYFIQTTINNENRIVKLEEAIIELHFKIGNIKRAEFRKAFWNETITNYKTKYITIYKTNYINEVE